MLPVAGLKSGKSSLLQKRREIKKQKIRVRTRPYCPDQAVGVFCVLERLNNNVLEPLECAMVGVFTLGFLTAYCFMFFFVLVDKVAKYFKGIQK